MFFIFVILLSQLQNSQACIVQPRESIVMSIQNRTWAVGTHLKVDVQIQYPTPEFKTVLRLSEEVVDESSFIDNFKPKNISISYMLERAGLFKVQFEVLWLGKPFSIIDSILVYKPVLKTNFELIMEEIVLYPTGSGSLSLKIFGSRELPTNLTGKLNWGDGDPQDLDLASKTRPGASAKLFVPFTHRYEKTGNYTIEVTLFNEVSSATNTKDVRVITRLVIENIEINAESDLSATKKKSSIFFRSGEMLSFSTNLRSGDPDSFYIQTEDKNISSPHLPVNYTFVWAGIYNVQMWAFGAAGTSNILTKTLKIQKPVTDEHVSLSIQDIIVSPPGFASLGVTITDPVELPTGIVGSIEWEENAVMDFDWEQYSPAGTKGEISLAFNYNYLVPSTYNISIEINNRVSRVSKIINTKVISKLVVENIYASNSLTFDDEEDEEEGKNGEIFATNKEIYFKVKMKSGEPDIYYLGIDGNNVTSDSQPMSYSLSMAGSQTVMMWTTGQAGESNSMDLVITVQKPVSTDHLNIQINEIIVTPPGLASLVLTITDQDELPTSISGSVVWEEHKVTNFDWKEYTTPGSTGVVSKTFNHTYSDPANYTITVQISNLVSQITETVEAKVIPELTIEKVFVSKKATFRDGGTDLIFATNQEVFFRTDLTSGDPSTFHLEIDGVNITSDTLPISYTIPTAGTYTVRMWVIGLAGQSNEATKTIKAQRQISEELVSLQIQNIIVTPPGLASVDVSVSDETELPTDIFGSVEWQEGHVTNFDWRKNTTAGSKGTISTTFNHTYSLPSNYTISLKIMNEVSEITKLISANVIPHLTVEDISVSASPTFDDGGTDVVFASNQEIYFKTGLKSGQLDTFYLEIDGANITSETLPISHTIPWAGTYVVRMWVTGQAGISNIANKTIIIQRAVNEEQVSLQIQDIIVTPPGRASLEVTVVGEEELPTNISGSIIWDKNSTKDFNWTEYSRDGSRGPISFSFNTTYECPSNYSLSVRISNRVSEITKSIAAYVIPELTVEKVYVSNSSVFTESSESDNVFASNKEIFFKTDLKSGTADIFHLEINGNNETAESLPLSSTIILAGRYDVRMWVSGEAGVSNIVHKIIAIQKSITPDHVELQIRDIIVTPPGLAILYISISDEEELPTSLSGLVTWKDDVVTEFNWEDYTSPREKGIFRRDFNYTYLNPSNYMISVEISNSVSQISKFISTNVIPELAIERIIISSSLTDDDEYSRVFASDEEIYFRTSLNTGDSDTYVLEINNENITSKTIPISYSIPMAGSYLVRMWVTGEAGMSNVLGENVTIERALSEDFLDIEIEDIIVTPPGVARLNISLYAPSELPTAVHGIITWQRRETDRVDWRDLTLPGSMDPISKEVRHSYFMPGNYTILVELRNSISSVLKSVSVMVVPRLTIEGLLVENPLLPKDKTNSFPTRTLLSISTKIRSGVPDMFYLQIDDKIINSEEQPISYSFRRSGMYTLTFWVTGLAGISNEVTRKVEIQREIFSDTIEIIGIPERPVGHKGLVSFTVDVMDLLEAPTDVHVDVIWGDDSPKETFLLTPSQNAMNESILQSVVEHQYTTFGNYKIKMLIRNDVSNFSKEFTVTVVEKISLRGISIETENYKTSHITPLCKYASPLTDDNAILKPQQFSGFVTKWRLTIGNFSVMESTEGTFKYNFTMAGWYTITLTAFGLDNDTETVSRSVFMGEEVTDLVAAAYPNITSMNLPSVIGIRTSWVSGACLLIDFGDGSKIQEFCDSLQCNEWSDEDIAVMRPPNPDVFAKNNYEETGYYEVVVQLIGPLNSLTKTVGVVVTDKVICEKMKIAIENPTTRENPKKIRRQDNVRLKSRSILSGCRGQIDTTIEWNIEEIDENFEDLIPSKKGSDRSRKGSTEAARSTLQAFPVKREANLSLFGLELNKPILIVPPKNLSYGMFYVSVTYYFQLNYEINGINHPMEAKLVEVTVIEVIKSKLVTKMREGSATSILRGDQQLLTLCPACYSYDPDNSFEITNYTWFCKREGEEWTSTAVPSFSSSRKGYEKKRDQGGCFGDGPGILNITAGGLSWNASLFYVIPAKYSVQVEIMSEDGRTGRSIMDLEIVRGDPPILSSSCTPEESCIVVDGIVYVNPVKMVFSTSCVQDRGLERQDLQDTLDLGDDGCGQPLVQYEWTMLGVGSGANPKPVKLNLTGHAVGMDRFNFAILESFWKSDMGNYSQYKVKVSGTREGQESQGKTMLIMKPNKPPEGGTCTILRNETSGLITALVEEVTLNCSGWKDPENRGVGRYKFSVLYESGSKNPLWSGSKFPATLYFPYGNFTLLAEIFDLQEAVAMHVVGTVTTGLPENEEYDAYIKSGILSAAIEKQELSLVNMLLQAEKSVKPYIQSNKLEDDTEKNAQYLQTLDAFPTSNIDEVLQASFILSSVAYPLPEEEQSKAIDTLKSLSGKSGNQATSPNLQKEFASSALGTVVSLLKGVNEVKGNKSQDTSIQTTKSPPTEQSAKDAEKNEKVKNMMDAIENSQKGILQSSVVGEGTAVMKSEGSVTSAVGFFDASELEGKQIDVDGALYVFPHYCDLFQESRSCLVNKSISIGVKMAKWVKQVFGFGGGQDLLSEESSTVQLSLVDKWMNPIPVNNSFGDIIIHIPREASDIPDPTFIVPEMKPKQKFMVHKINISETGLGVNIFLRLEDNNTEDYDWILTWSALPPYNIDNFTIYYLRDLKFFEELGFYGLFISSEEVGDEIGPRYLGIARKNVSRVNETEGNFTMSDDNLKVLSGADGTLFSRATTKLFATKSSLQSTTLPRSFLYDYDIFIEDQFSHSFENETFFNNDTFIDFNVTHDYDNSTRQNNETLQLIAELEDTFDTNYTLLTFVSSCLFFDKVKIAWSSEGCKAIGANLTTTTCACNHLTSFGSGMIVAPNAIDFSYVFANAGFTENLTIYLTLIFMGSLSIIGFVYARFMDIQDKKKIGATPLPDNDPNDKYLYDIFVHTGLYPGSGTKSNVYFNISGEWDDTGARELKDPTRPVLCRGGHDHFVMAVERPLGPLQYLRIWHDNSAKGSKASWFLSYMVVRDIQSGEEFQFISNQWLAVEEGDGQIDRIVPVAGEAEMKDFSHVFGMTVERNLSDDHLWISVFLRPPRSRFTRFQRLGAVVALLFLSMLVNAMFYDKVPDNPSDGGLTVGPFSLSPQAMSVGLMSNIIVFLPSFIIVFFFRKSRPRKIKPSRIKQALDKQRLSADPESRGASPLPQKKKMVESDDRSLIVSPTSSERRLIRKKLSDSTSLGSASYTKEEKILEIKKQKKFRLPWWCRIIAWILVVLSIGSSVFFLWAYGIQFGDSKVQRWLTSLVVSIVSSMFITQPIKIYMMAAILSMILRKPLNDKEDYDDDEELMELEYDEEFMHEKESSSSKKKRLKVGSPLSKEELKAAREKREKEVAMNSLIKEITIYLLFLSVILAISYGSRDPWIIYMKNHFSDLFAKSSSDNCPSFLKMRTTDDLWCWSRETFVPAILDDELYNGMSIYDPEITDQLETTLSDRTSYLLGKAVFRQIRVIPDNCVMNKWIRENLISECNGFSGFYQEHEDIFGKGWELNTTRPDPAYTYHSPLSVQGIPYSGTLDTYGGGGYFVQFPRRKAKAMAMIDDLVKNSWIDKYTRGFFAEVSIYNAQVNLFGVIMCVAEFLPGGGIEPSFKFQGLNLLRYHSGAGIFMLVSELTFVIFTIFFIRREHQTWKKEGKKYFKIKWNWLEIVVIFLSISTIVFYAIKTIYSLYLIDQLTSTRGKKYIRMQSLAVFDESLTYIIGFLLFIATIKLLKLLRFNKRIGFLTETLKASSSDILGFAVLFIVTLISFVTVFHLEAITASVEFSTFIRAAETSIFEITKKFKEVTIVSPILGPTFYFIFALIMNWVVLQVLIAIICNTFARIKQDLSAQPNDYEVVEYMMDRFVKFLIAIRLKKGKVAIHNPENQSAEENLRHINTTLDTIIIVLERKD